MTPQNPILAIQLFRSPYEGSDLIEIKKAEAVVFRADYIENDDYVHQLSLTSGIKIYSLRSKKEGGKYNGSIEERHSRILHASRFNDIIELEAETDLTNDILRNIPPQKRLISWHGKAHSYNELEQKYTKISAYDSRFYQIINRTDNISEGIWALQLLRKYRPNKLISFTSGNTGVWTQILAAYSGSAISIGNLNKSEGEESFLTYEQLKQDYSLPHIRRIKKVYGITGNPVFSSMSPQIHNKCYEKLGLEALYLPFHIEEFDDFWQFISVDFPAADLDLKLGGFTMVSPYKEESYNASKGHICSATLTSKACNILINKDEEWHSDSSDGLGVLAALDDRGFDVEGLKAAIIGCGGAGRTIATRLKEKGAEIVFYNRSTERGDYASKLLDIPFQSLDQLKPNRYDIIINATPVGKHGKNLIFDPSNLRSTSLVIDMAYTKEDTRLVSKCHEQNINVIEGKQILLHQVKKQFSGLTGLEMPLEVVDFVRKKTSMPSDVSFVNSSLSNHSTGERRFANQDKEWAEKELG